MVYVVIHPQTFALPEFVKSDFCVILITGKNHAKPGFRLHALELECPRFEG